MEKEKKVNANESTVTVVETECKEAKLYVERKAFKSKDGRDMWSYAVNGNVRGKDVKVDFEAYDKGGYEVLELVFDIKDKADLIMRDESMTDAETGEIKNYTVYYVSNVDEDGDELTCRVKPSRDSDKSILAYLLKKLNRKLNSDNSKVEN